MLNHLPPSHPLASTQGLSDATALHGLRRRLCCGGRQLIAAVRALSIAAPFVLMGWEPIEKPEKKTWVQSRNIKSACWYPWCAWPAQQSHRPSFTEDRCTKGPSPDAEFQQTPVHSHHRLTNTWIGPFSQLQANSEDDKPVPIMSCLHLSRI